MTDGSVLAVDIGGTKMAVGIVAADGRVITSTRTPTPPAADGETIWAALLAAIEALPGLSNVSAVGVGCGGPMAWPAGAVSPLNIPGWRGFPLRQRLADTFAGLPVRLHNDAICFAAAEHWRGAGIGVDNMLGMVVSTGVGGGLVLAGKVVDGSTGNGGHVGHVVVEPAGPPCPCGGRGCLEGIARGPAVAAWAVEHGWQPTGEVTARALADDARAGNEVAIGCLRPGRPRSRHRHRIDRRVARPRPCRHRRRLSSNWRAAVCSRRAAIAEHAKVEFLRELTVVPAALGNDAGLVGAAALVLAGDRYWSSS